MCGDLIPDVSPTAPALMLGGFQGAPPAAIKQDTGQYRGLWAHPGRPLFALCPLYAPPSPPFAANHAVALPIVQYEGAPGSKPPGPCQSYVPFSPVPVPATRPPQGVRSSRSRPPAASPTCRAHQCRWLPRDSRSRRRRPYEQRYIVPCPECRQGVCPFSSCPCSAARHQCQLMSRQICQSPRAATMG